MRKSLLLIFLLVSTIAYAASDSYIDIGSGQMPFTPKKKCTYLSTGKRFEKGKGKFEASISHRMATSSKGNRYLTGKSGPNPHVPQSTTTGFQHYLSGNILLKHQLTDNLSIGAGPGLGTLFDYNKGRLSTASAATVDAVVSYKLPSGNSPVKPEFQLGVTQPMHVFHNHTGKALEKKPAAFFALKLRY